MVYCYLIYCFKIVDETTLLTVPAWYVLVVPALEKIVFASLELIAVLDMAALDVEETLPELTEKMVGISVVELVAIVLPSLRFEVLITIAVVDASGALEEENVGVEMQRDPLAELLAVVVLITASSVTDEVIMPRDEVGLLLVPVLGIAEPDVVDGMFIF